MKYVVSDKARDLNPPKVLDKHQFTRRLSDVQTALKLVTLSPLFTTLNDQCKK